MRKKRIVFMIALSLIATTLSAQVHAISSPRFARPLVEKWIEEYAKVEPDVHFKLLNGCGCTKESELYILPYSKEATEADNTNDNVIYFAAYAILPFTAADSEAAQILGGRKLNNKRLRNIFFEHEYFTSDEELTKQEKREKRLVVYSANNGASTTDPFSAFFQESTGSLRGKRIAGDDAFLTAAVKKDPLGVSFNALSNLYDLDSRKLKEGLSILQLATKKELEESLINTTTLDTLVELLEKYTADEVPTGKLGLAYKGDNKEVQRFLAWVLTAGRQLNHHYGLLQIDEQLAQQQIEAINTGLTAQNR